MRIVVIHGPNLNLLGTREPEIYGTQTLEDIDREIAAHARARGTDVESFQSNHEGEIIDRIQQAAGDGTDAIVINPAAYSHTSVAIYDAIRSVSVPVVEVHISNIHARDDMRHRMVTAKACAGIVGGFGLQSYLLGLDAALALLKS